MTIIEARELAMQGKTMIAPSGAEYTPVMFNNGGILMWTERDVFGKWREKREPRRVYLVLSENGNTRMSKWCFDKKEDAECEMGPGRRIVEFVEVEK